jgi:transposase
MRKLVLKAVRNQSVPAPGTAVIIGVDLSRTKWVYACRWGGQERRRFASAGALQHLQALVQEYQARGCEVHVVYEACGFGYEIAWRLEEQRARVIVVSPSTVERAPGPRVKTDGRDAGSLALKYEQGLLKGIYIPSREQHELRQLSRTYAQVLKDRRRQQVRLRLLLQEHGYAPPERGTGWPALERWLSTQALPAPLAVCSEQLVSLRTAASVSARRLAKELRAVARLPQYAPLVRALAQQPGVGPFTAVRFVLELGDVHRFVTADSLPNYLGLTPREYSSGPLVHRGPVRKSGPGALRAWLVQCAWAAVRHGHDEGLLGCFERLEARAGRKKAIVAVARKLALRLRARWLEFEAAPPVTTVAA